MLAALPTTLIDLYNTQDIDNRGDAPGFKWTMVQTPEDLQLFDQFRVPFALGLGVIDVKTHDVESAGVVADRIRRALQILPAERLIINPDCGLVHLPRDVAFMKLCAMVDGTRLVRQEVTR